MMETFKGSSDSSKVDTATFFKLQTLRDAVKLLMKSINFKQQAARNAIMVYREKVDEF
jgi:hypothetical protein